MTADPPSRRSIPKARKMRLDELLVARGLAETRSQAQRLILAGEVWVNEGVIDKAGHSVSEDAAIRVEEGQRYVSRGGLKLEAALDAFGISPHGWVCADVGASTGGFTDCLLQRGAAKVYAIDVGYGQLAWSLRQDPRVISIERANIRYLDALPEAVTLVAVDVSFIGLDLVLPALVRLLVQGTGDGGARVVSNETPQSAAPEGHVIALIKPQFEVGKGQVGKGGVVREAALHRWAIAKVLADASAHGLAPAGLLRSPITGPAGNVEFLAWLKLGDPMPAADTVARWVAACVPPR